jgi:hypothetical protein
MSGGGIRSPTFSLGVLVALEPHDHGENHIELLPVEPVAMSLHLWMHDVLRTHSLLTSYLPTPSTLTLTWPTSVPTLHTDPEKVDACCVARRRIQRRKEHSNCDQSFGHRSPRHDVCGRHYAHNQALNARFCYFLEAH